MGSGPALWTPAAVRIPAGDGDRNGNPRNRVRSGFGVGAGPEPDRAVIMGRNRNRNGAGGGPEPVHGGGWGRGRPPLSRFLSALPSGFPVSPVRTLYIVYGFSGPLLPFLSRSFFNNFLTRILHTHHWLSGTYVLSVVCWWVLAVRKVCKSGRPPYVCVCNSNKL